MRVLNIDIDGSQTEGIARKVAITGSSGSIKRAKRSRTCELDRNSSRAAAYVRGDAPTRPRKMPKSEEHISK